MKTPHRAEHTQLPWAVSNESGIRGPRNEPIAGGLFPADAALIVHRVNMFEELVEAVKTMHDALGHDECGGKDDCAACDIDDLITRASQGGSKP